MQGKKRRETQAVFALARWQGFSEGDVSKDLTDAR